MSKTVDERVVSLQLDNKNLESNAKTSMGTLDKLKDKLNFKGVAKGADVLGSAVKKIDMSGLGKGVADVHAKFSALEVMGVTALANITNSAVNAGKRIAASLTIEPIRTGFNEYELKMDSVRTIMASTGESVEKVNEYLEELNAYSDQTIYSFSDMTQNIGKFTNAGVKLEDAVLAIKGISNEAAVSGANANEASRAMYNFAQALSAGYVKLIDWKSIELANMATKEFKEQLLEAAVNAGTLTKSADGLYTTLGGTTLNATKNFNDSLKDEWMTTEVLISTLKDYSDSTTEIGKKAFAAAQDVTKFTQMMDVLKETAQSGWAKTWELIFGDIEKAKAIFTPLTNFFSKIIDKISDARNNLLESVLGKNFKSLAKNLSSIMKTTKKTVGGAVDALQDLGKIVDDVIIGKFGNGVDRFNKLSEAGYNYYKIQNKVNEKLGNSFRYSEKLADSQKELTKSKEKAVEVETELSDVEIERLANLTKMSDAELEALGYTKKQIEAVKELKNVSEKLGIPIKELLENIDEIDGRWLIIESFKNVGESILKIFTAIGDAWKDTIGSIDPDIIFDAIGALHKFTDELIISDNAAKNIKNIFEGIFAGMQIANMAIGGGFMAIIKIAGAVLQLFGTNLLEVGGNIAKYIVQFRDWIKEHTIFIGHFNKIAEIIKAVIDGVNKCINAFLSLKIVTKTIDKIQEKFKGFFEGLNLGFDSFSVKGIVENINKIFDNISKWIKGLDEVEDVGKYIVTGLIKGIQTGITTVGKCILNLGKTIINTICSVLGIASPSKVMIAIGGFIISGLILGLKGGVGSFKDFFTNLGTNTITLVKNLASKIISFIKKIDFGAVTAVAITAGFMIIAKKISDALMLFGEAAKGFGKLAGGVGKLLSDIGDRINPKKSKFEEITTGILKLAIAIGILAASVYVLSKVDGKSLLRSVGAIVVLAAVIGGLTWAIGNLNMKDSVELGKISIILLTLSGSIFILAKAMNILGSMGKDSMNQAYDVIARLAVVIAALIFATNLAGPSLDKMGGTFIRLSIALMLIVFTIKQIAKLDGATLEKGISFITLFSVFIAGLMLATRLAGPNIDGLGATILKISASILLLAMTARIIGSMDTNALTKGAIAIAAFGVIIAGLMAITAIPGVGNAKIGSTIFGIATSMLIMALAVKMLGSIDTSTLVKGELAVAGLAGIIVGLIAATKLAGNAKGLALNMLGISISIGILAGLSLLLGLIKTENLIKGIIAVGLLGGIVALLIMSTKNAQDCKGNLIALTVALAVLVGALVGLSFIDPKKLASATLALSAVLGMFAVLVKTSSALNGVEKLASKMLIGLLALTAMVVPMLLFVSVLSKMDGLQNAATNAVVLAGLMIVMTALLTPLCTIGQIMLSSKGAAALGIAALAAMMVPLFAFVWVLSSMSGIQNATSNAVALSTLATVMTLLLIPLCAIGLIMFASYGICAIGIAALAAMALPLGAFVLVLAKMQNIQNATSNVNLLIDLATAMTNILVKLAIISPLALLGLGALTGLTSLMIGLGVLAVGIGALMEKFPSLQSFLNKGLPVLVQLAGGIGQMIGAFVGGIMTEIASSLPTIGQCLSDFMNNAMDFINGAKLVDNAVLKGVAILAGAIIALTAADLIAGVVSFLSGGTSFATLGTELSTFMKNAEDFIVGAKSIDPKAIEGVKNLATAIMLITGANLLESITRFITGESSLESFGTQLGYLGQGINDFITKLGPVTDDQLGSANKAAEIIKTLAKAASEIPNSGGLAGFFAGENDMDTWAVQLPVMAEGIAKFTNKLVEAGLSKDSVSLAEKASEIIKVLAGAAAEIPNAGGLLAGIVGDNEFGVWAVQLPNVAAGIAGFTSKLTEAGLSKDSVSLAENAASVVKTLAGAAAEIPNAGGLLASIVGDNDFSTWATELPKVGEGVAGFANKLGDFGKEKIATIDAAVKAINAISKMSKDYGSVKDSGDFTGFGNGMITLAEKIKSFVDKMAEIGKDSVSSAVTKTKELIELAKTVANTNVESCKTFGDSLKKVAEDGIKGFVKAFTDTKPKSDVKKAAKDIMDTFIKAAEGKKDDVKKAFKKIAEAAADNIATKSIISDFKSAGKDLGDGLVKGIKAKETAVYNAAFALGQKAVQGEKDGQQSNSPSKLTIKAGKWLGEGLIVGMQKISSRVYKSGTSLGKSTTDALSAAVSRISDIVNGDIDTQPTIRPVLDLSDVESGANRIGSMFSSRTLAVSTNNVGAISASMSKIQNGGNSDIISAINKLRKDVGNLGNNNYNFNGINYDEGSDVAEALKTLVRAAKVERRV